MYRLSETFFFSILLSVGGTVFPKVFPNFTASLP